MTGGRLGRGSRIVGNIFEGQQFAGRTVEIVTEDNKGILWKALDRTGIHAINQITSELCFIGNGAQANATMFPLPFLAH